MTILIVARHGNTFEDGETPRRVGRRTDLTLTARGEEQARKLGALLKARGLVPDTAFCGTLRRTRETARLALAASGATCGVAEWPMFDEIDYGPDENRTEDDVLARIGPAALDAWEKDGAVPPGWLADPEALRQEWRRFADSLPVSGHTVLAVTSNGIARFAPAITGDFEGFKERFSLKLATGACGILKHGPEGWAVQEWNIRP